LLANSALHKLLGYLGVIIDVDAQYSLEKPKLEEVAIDETFKSAPWYHVVMENEQGYPIHTYVAEAQIDREAFPAHPEQTMLDELAESIRNQLQAPRLRN
jgi:heat shock protein HspQ